MLHINTTEGTVEAHIGEDLNIKARVISVQADGDELEQALTILQPTPFRQRWTGNTMVFSEFPSHLIVQGWTKYNGPIVLNAVTCTICQSPADRYRNYFQCKSNPNHLGDLNVGIFSDLTPP